MRTSTPTLKSLPEPAYSAEFLLDLVLSPLEAMVIQISSVFWRQSLLDLQRIYKAKRREMEPNLDVHLPGAEFGNHSVNSLEFKTLVHNVGDYGRTRPLLPPQWESRRLSSARITGNVDLCVNKLGTGEKGSLFSEVGEQRIS